MICILQHPDIPNQLTSTYWTDDTLRIFIFVVYEGFPAAECVISTVHAIAFPLRSISKAGQRQVVSKSKLTAMYYKPLPPFPLDLSNTYGKQLTFSRVGYVYISIYKLFQMISLPIESQKNAEAWTISFRRTESHTEYIISFSFPLRAGIPRNWGSSDELNDLNPTKQFKQITKEKRRELTSSLTFLEVQVTVAYSASLIHVHFPI